jgi:hypothetical protein
VVSNIVETIAIEVYDYHGMRNFNEKLEKDYKSE